MAYDEANESNWYGTNDDGKQGMMMPCMMISPMMMGNQTMMAMMPCNDGNGSNEPNWYDGSNDDGSNDDGSNESEWWMGPMMMGPMMMGPMMMGPMNQTGMMGIQNK